MKKQLFILFSLFAFVAQAQQHPALLSLKGIGGNGDDAALPYITPIADGGWVISFESTSTEGPIDSICNMTDPTTIFQKYNANGIFEWSKCYASAGGDTFLLYTYPQNNGDIILGGEFTLSYDWGLYICKQDATGNILWGHGYSKGNGAFPYNMIATTDGGYLMTGAAYYTDTNFTVHNSGSLFSDIAVLKLDSLGNKQWGKAIGGSYDDLGVKAVNAPGDGFYIVGSTESDDSDCTGYKGGIEDAYIARLDSNGNILWHRDLGGSGKDAGTSACSDGKGGVIVAAYTNSSDSDVHHYIGGGYNYWAIDIDSSGSTVWDNCYGGASAIPAAICRATDGSIWLNGNSDGQGGEIDTAYDTQNGDTWIVHADSVGNFLSEKVLGSLDQDQAYMICPLSNGMVMAGGYFSAQNGSFINIPYYGNGDAYLAVFAPWTEDVPQIDERNNTIDVYPNPADENVTIKWQQQVTEIMITDVTGRQQYIAPVKGQQSVVVNVSNWAAGIYFVRLMSSDGNEEAGKLLVR